MSRTRRKGWTAATGSDSDNRGIKHHATNDWFSKKNTVKVDPNTHHEDEYWGRDKAGVKARFNRKIRRKLNRIISTEVKMSVAEETQTLIDELKQKLGIDYSKGQHELAELVNSQFSGNWDNSTDFDPALGLRDIRVIEENEYDQSMDDPPEYLFQSSLGYVLFA